MQILESPFEMLLVLNKFSLRARVCVCAYVSVWKIGQIIQLNRMSIQMVCAGCFFPVYTTQQRLVPYLCMCVYASREVFIKILWYTEWVPCHWVQFEIDFNLVGFLFSCVRSISFSSNFFIRPTLSLPIPFAINQCLYSKNTTTTTITIKQKHAIWSNVHSD